MLKIIKKFYKGAIIFFLFTVFLITNIHVVTLLYFFSTNIFLEIYRFFQLFLFLAAIIVLFKKINKTLTFIAVFIFYTFYLILSEYLIITHTALDFDFFRNNFTDLRFILFSYLTPLLVVILLGFANTAFICKIKLKNKKALYLLFALTITIIIYPRLINDNNLNNELVIFAENSYHNDKTINHYQNYYNNLIKKSKNNKNKILSQAKKISRGNLPDYLDNIIFLQLESMNKFLVNKKDTPNLIKIAGKGVFFPSFYGNSVMTIYGQENILCSMPSSFYLGLVQTGADKNMLCLPEIMDNLGYKTFFLKSYTLKFTETGKFMKDLGFDEVHAYDIMQPDDAKYPWGYKEEIFYKRAFDYLEKNKTKNNFIYIEVGPTNHWPFNTPPEYIKDVPYKNPKNYREKIADTTYLQDKYLAIAWKRLNKMFPAKNYTAFIVSDHSWPIGMHKGDKKNNMADIFNQRYSYEENFLSSMALILGGQKEYANKIIINKYSNMDIMPSVLSMFNINYPKNKFSRSFMGELSGDKAVNAEKNILLIQPYGDKYINIINKNLKYQYNSRNKNFTLYNLKNDKMEERGKIIGAADAKNTEILKKLIGF